MPRIARITISTVFVILAGLSPVAWLIASEYPPSLLGQWLAAIGGIVFTLTAMLFALWKPPPPRGFPVEIKQAGSSGNLTYEKDRPKD